MKLSECVAVLEHEVEILKAREKELMQRCGELLERARKAEQFEAPSDVWFVPPSVLEYLIAADNCVVTMLTDPQWGPLLVELAGEAREARQAVDQQIKALRVRFAKQYASKAAGACKSTS